MQAYIFICVNAGCTEALKKIGTVFVLFGATILDYFFYECFKLLTFKIKIKAVGFIHHIFSKAR